MANRILSDSQKEIILKYYHQNSSVYSEEMIQELNRTTQQSLPAKIWHDSIEFWKQTVQENYKYAEKTRNLVTSYEDLELLIIIKATKSKSRSEEHLKIDQSQEGTTNCRICLTIVDRGESLNIFTSFLDNISLGQLLNTCTSIIPVAEQDGLPEMICFNCSKLLRSLYNFKILCENSDRHFRTVSLPDPVDVFDDDTVSVYQVDYSYEEDFNEFDQSSGRNPILEMVKELPEEVHGTEDEQTADQNPQVVENVEKTQKQCEHCGTIFKTIRSLRMHRKVHTGDKPHACQHCTKSFRTRLALKIHIRSHTNERPYVCETCGKGFKTISSINNHRAIHQEERQFACPVCPYRASTKANLKIHHRTHTGLKPYTCQLCGLSFLTASNMQKHIRNIHKKLKTHKCEECDRSFFTKESAIKHAVTHSGLKPYACPECTQSYGWYNGLQKHMRIQHREATIPKEKTFLEALQKMR